MLTICSYLGTIKGADPDLSPICKNKKTSRTRPEWTQRVGPHRVPTGLQGSTLQDLNVLLEPLLCCPGRVFWVLFMLEYPSMTRAVTVAVTTASLAVVGCHRGCALPLVVVHVTSHTEVTSQHNTKFCKQV